MKPQSPFTHTMDGLRPRPARRAVMLQRILATRQPPLSLHQWRWALAGVPAVVVLALGLAWGLGAYDPTGTSEPDRVTQAALAATPSASATPAATAALSAVSHSNTSTVIWLAQVKQSSSRVGLRLPTSLELVRTQAGQLSAEEIQSIVQKLQSAGWQSAQIASVKDGLYTISAKKEAAGDQDADNATSAQIFEDSGVMGIASHKKYKVDSQLPTFYGLSYILQGNGIESGYQCSYDVQQGFINVQMRVGLAQYEHLGFVNTLPFGDALKNAFYLRDGKMLVNSDALVDVVSADFVTVSGVPCYRFLVCSKDGISTFGYALAIKESELNALPELATHYQDFLNGKTMQIEIINRMPEAPQQFINSQSLPNLTLDPMLDTSAFPRQGGLFDAGDSLLTEKEEDGIMQSLADKGWQNFLRQTTDDGLLFRAKYDKKAGENQEAVYQKLLEDIQLPDSLTKQDFQLLEATFSPENSMVQVPAKVQGIVVPGWMQIKIYPDNAVRCLMHAEVRRLLQSVPLLSLEQALPGTIWFRELPAPWIMDDSTGKVVKVELVYVRGIPYYHMRVQSPEMDSVVDAYALAVDKKTLQQFPKALQGYEAFMQGRVDPNIGNAITQLDP